MKKFIKLAVFLMLIWNTGMPTSFWHTYNIPANEIPSGTAQFAIDSLQRFWKGRLHKITATEPAYYSYTPDCYFADLYTAKQIWYDLTGSDNLPAFILLQNEVMRVMERQNPSRASIDAARSKYFPELDDAEPINWKAAWLALLSWLLRQYLFGLPFVGLLFCLWVYENPYFRRFAGSPIKLLFVTLLWPLFLWLVLKRKFEDHYFSIVAETLVRRTKKSLTGTLTKTERLLVRELPTKRLGILQGFQLLLNQGHILRHGMLVSLSVVCSLRVSAQMSTVISMDITTIIVADIYHPPPDCYNDVYIVVPYEAHSYTERRGKIFFHYIDRIVCGFVRALDPIPWFCSVLFFKQDCSILKTMCNEKYHFFYSLRMPRVYSNRATDCY